MSQLADLFKSFGIGLQSSRIASLKGIDGHQKNGLINTGDGLHGLRLFHWSLTGLNRKNNYSYNYKAKQISYKKICSRD